MTDQRQGRPGRGRDAMGRVAALVGSVMDLHVRIALQEVDQEKRRLISGALLLSGGLTMMLLSLITAEVALLIWFHESLMLSWIHSSLAVASLNVVMAGVFIRIGGGLMKGPFLPQTTAGLTKTTRALLGR